MRLGRLTRRAAALIGVGVAASAAVVTVRHLLATPAAIESGLPGQPQVDHLAGGSAFSTVSGPTGAPALVLVHDFYPGASSFEYRGLVPRLSAHYQVHALDWLGYGLSERPALHFTGELYAALLSDYLREKVRRPAIVIAHGHAANAAARVASDAPELFAGLALVAPWVAAGERLDPTMLQVAVKLAQRTRVGLALFAFLSTRTALRWLSLRRGDASASEGALDHQQAAARQFGAEHAALAMLTGELDLPLQPMLPLLRPPTIIIGGERDQRVTPERLRDLALLRPHTSLAIIPGAGAAAFEDQPVRFIEAIRPWLLASEEPTTTSPEHAPTLSQRALPESVSPKQEPRDEAELVALPGEPTTAPDALEPDALANFEGPPEPAQAPDLPKKPRAPRKPKASAQESSASHARKPTAKKAAAKKDTPDAAKPALTKPLLKKTVATKPKIATDRPMPPKRPRKPATETNQPPAPR